MTPMTERLRFALQFATAEMPTAKDQQLLSTYFENMRKRGEQEKFIVRSLTALVYDGLAYGNWPAVVTKDD